MEYDNKYEKIIGFMCTYKNVSREELFKILKDKKCKYILLLLLKKYRCSDIHMINGYFPDYSKRALSYGFKKAEEKLFINKDFRDEFFEVEDYIEKTL